MRGREGTGRLSPLSLDDAIAIEGGPLELGSSLPGIPAKAIGDAVATLAFLANVFLNNLEDREDGLFIALTRSSGLACRVRQVSEGASAILVPAGLIGRLRTLCRTLLRFWNKESHVRLMNSPMDKIAEDQWQVPPKLAPLFDSRETGDSFWQHLQELDDSLDLDPRFDPDIPELLHLGLVFLLCHEFAHVLFRHFDFLAAIRQTKPDDAPRIRRGLELHADSFSGTWATTIFFAQLGRDADMDSLARGFLRQSYVVSLILAIFDAQKKFLGFYDNGDYNHPIIRREVFADACRNEAGSRGKEFLDFWTELEMQGWKRAVEALADLNFEAMGGKFGKIDEGKLAYPLQALNYGAGFAFSFMQDLFNDANTLLKDVKDQLREFNKNVQSNPV